jgi:hypothetical protein
MFRAWNLTTVRDMNQSETLQNGFETLQNEPETLQHESKTLQNVSETKRSRTYLEKNYGDNFCCFALIL